jgi:glycyl-tRNA synthetase
LKLTLFPRDNQEEKKGTIEMTIEEALSKGLLNNETHAYFVGRTYLFMRTAGLLPEGIRFRQHLSNEMAHYAKDCWDCELLTSYGWVECVGIADRSCFDLDNHAKGSKSDLTAFEMYKEPKLVDVVELAEKKGGLSKAFKQQSKTVLDHLKALSEADMLSFQKELESNGSKTVTIGEASFVIKSDMMEFVKVQKKENGRNYTPAVIEPSFGIGRIIYAILEHSYWVRESKEKEDKKEKDGNRVMERNVLSLAPTIAPFKVVVLPLCNDERFDEFILKIASSLAKNGISYRKDDSGAAIGRRYARCDEIGIPFAITIDFDSLKDTTVTLRERDSCFQIRAKADEVVSLIADMMDSRITWEDVLKKYPVQQQSASEKVGKKE